MTMLFACGGTNDAVSGEDPEMRPILHEDEAPRIRPEVRFVGVTNADGSPVAVRIQVADDEFERARGLMYRRSLDPDAGMLFVFEAPEDTSFWMENTFIPLDVIFIDENLQVAGIVTDTVPLSRDPIEIGQPSLYVLEVNAGFVRTHGIQAGGQIELHGVSLPRESP